MWTSETVTARTFRPGSTVRPPIGNDGVLHDGQADIIMINLDDLNVMPVNDPVSSAVLICNPSNVSWVLIDGQVRKRDGKLVGIDIDRSKRLITESHAFLTRGLDQSGTAKAE